MIGAIGRLVVAPMWNGVRVQGVTTLGYTTPSERFQTAEASPGRKAFYWRNPRQLNSTVMVAFRIPARRR